MLRLAPHLDHRWWPGSLVRRDRPDLRHPHLRVPDERARLRAPRRAARGRRPRARRLGERGRRGGAQHLLHPGERRQQALRQARPPEVAEGRPSGPGDHRRRLPGPEGPGPDPAAGRARRRGVRHPQRAPGRRAAARLARAGPGHRDLGRGPRRGRGLPLGSGREARGRLLGLGHHPDRLRQHLCLLHRAVGAGQGDQPSLRRARRRGRAPGRRRRRRGHPARPERELLRPRPHQRPSRRPSRRSTTRPWPALGGPTDPARRARPLFADLLGAVAAVEGIHRVRYTSPHPKDLRPETIAAMADNPAVCNHLHLPLQSGSDRILAAMHRGYTAERYLEKLVAARAGIPDLAVTTDLIVGFPGETDADFEQTLEVVAEAEYDSAYTFIFSPRAGTEGAADGRPVRRPGRGGGALRAPPGGRRALGPGPAPGAGRPHRGGRGRGTVQAGPVRAHRPHHAEQARALRVRRGRCAPAPSPPPWSPMPAPTSCAASWSRSWPRPVTARASPSPPGERPVPVRRPGPRGRHLAIVGPTASGKSALALAWPGAGATSRSSPSTRCRCTGAWTSARPSPRRPSRPRCPTTCSTWSIPTTTTPCRASRPTAWPCSPTSRRGAGGPCSSAAPGSTCRR